MAGKALRGEECSQQIGSIYSNKKIKKYYLTMYVNEKTQKHHFRIISWVSSA